MRIRFPLFLSLLVAITALCSCNTHPSTPKALAQAAMDSLCQGHSFQGLTSLASKSLHNSILKACKDIEDPNNRRTNFDGTPEGFGLSLSRLEREFVFVSRAFEALGWKNKRLKVVSMEMLFPAPPEPHCHEMWQAGFAPPMDGYFINVGIYPNNGAPVISYIMWDEKTWKDKIDSKFKAYFIGK